MSLKQNVIYDLKEIDWKKRRPNRLVSVVGKRDAGKTTWLMYLAMKSEWRTKGIYLVIAQTTKARSLWAKLVPEGNIYPPSKSLLKKIASARQKLVDYYEKRNKPFPQNLHLSVYIDDCGAEKSSFLRSNEMEAWVCYSRQWEMDVTVSFQHFKNFAPSGRENSDEVIFLSTQDEKIIKDMRSSYVSMCPQAEFALIALKTQENYGACWIKNKGGKTRVDEIVFCHWIPLELFEAVVDDEGEEKLEFREYLPCGDPRWRSWMQENQKSNLISHRDEEDEDMPWEEEDQISHIHEDKFGRTIQVRCPKPKIKAD